MNVCRLTLLFLIAFASSGCLQDAVVTTSGGMLLSGPTFSGKTQVAYDIASTGDVVSVAGECSSMASSIEMSEDAGLTWAPPPSLTEDCAGTGTFSFSLTGPPTTSVWTSVFTSPTTAASTSFLIRVQSMLGVSRTSTIVVNFVPASSWPSVSFAIASSLDSESTSARSLNVTLSAPSIATVTVPISTIHISAEANDYTLSAGTLTFAPGETNQTLDVSIVNDAIYEGATPEDLSIVLAAPSFANLGGTPAHSFQISDDESMPSVRFASPTSIATEASGLVGTEVILSHASESFTYVTVQFNASTATAATDYNNSLINMTIAPLATSQDYNITILDDAAVEGTETLNLELVAPVGLTLGGAVTHTMSILDDDGGVALLTISDGGANDFGPALIGTPTDKTFTISNGGSAIATSMVVATPLMTPFDFKDGSYPGTGGDCGAVVAVAGSCTVVVTFTPTGVGLVGELIDISYYDGGAATSANRSIQGTGTAPAYTWLGTVGDGSWHTAGNWAGGTVPGAGNIAIFSPTVCGAFCNANITSAITIGGLNMQAGYAGTITQGTGAAIFDTGTIGDFEIHGGTFNGHSSAQLSTNRHFIMNGGSLNLSGADWTVLRDMDITGGSFNIGTSRLILSGSTSSTYNTTFATFQNVRVTKSNNLSLSTPMNISGDLELMTSVGALNSSHILLQGNLTVTNAFGGNTNINMMGTGNQTITGVLGQKLPSLTINKPGGTLYLSGTIDLERNLTYTSGTVDPQASTVRFVGSNAAAINAPGSTFYNLVFLKLA
jgi:hypothetical protein